MKKFTLAIVAAAGLFTMASAANAFTVTYGYLVGSTPGEVEFWFGSDHGNGGSTAGIPNEGALNLVGIGGTSYAPQQFNFDLLSTTLPTGLVTDVNYFYADSATGHRNQPGHVRSWIGVRIAGLIAGDYQFSFSDTNTSSFWEQWDQSLSGTVTVPALSPSVVPVPAALPLMASGFAMMGFFGMRRRKRTA